MKKLWFLLVVLWSFPALAATLSGKVMDDRGDSVPGVTVTFPGAIATTDTDSSGNYSLQIETGRLTFSKTGYATRTVESVISGSGGHTKNVVAEKLAICGVVRDSEDGRLVSAEVTVGGQTSSAGKGGYGLAVESGNHTLQARADGYLDFSLTPYVGDKSLRCDIDLQRRKIYGTVRDSESAIVAGQPIYFTKNGVLFDWTATDNEGRYFTYWPVVDGVYTVCVTPEVGSAPYTAAYTVTTGNNDLSHDIVLAPQDQTQYETQYVTYTPTGEEQLKAVLGEILEADQDTKIFLTGEVLVSGCAVQNRNNKRITIDGHGVARLKNNSAPGYYNAILGLQSPGITVKNLEIDGGGIDVTQISAQAPGGVIKNCIFTNLPTGYPAPVINITASASATTVVGCVVAGGISSQGQDAQIFMNTFELGGNYLNPVINIAEGGSTSVVRDNAITGITGGSPAIKISANMVRVAGNSITGTSTNLNSGVAIQFLGLGNAVIDHNDIRAVDSGIEITGEGGSVFYNNIKDARVAAIDISGAENVVLGRNTISNEAQGFRNVGNGIRVDRSAGVNILGNIISGMDTGVVVGNSRELLVEANQVRDNANYGIRITDSTAEGRGLQDNRSTGNKVGCYLENFSNFRARNETYSDNADRGLEMVGATSGTFYNLVSDSTVVSGSGPAGQFLQSNIDRLESTEQLPQVTDSIVSGGDWPGKTTLQAVTIIKDEVLLNRGIRYVKALFPDNGSCTGSFSVGGSETATYLLSGDGPSVVEAEIPVSPGISAAALQVVVATDLGISEAASSTPTIVGSKVEWSGSVARCVEPGQTDVLPFSLINLGNQADRFTLAHALTGAGSEDWEVKIYLGGVEVSGQSQSAGFKTAQLSAAAAGSQQGGGKEEGEIVCSPLKGLNSRAFTLNVSFESEKNPKNTETAAINYDLVRAAKEWSRQGFGAYHPERKKISFHFREPSASGVSALAEGASKEAQIYVYDLSGKVVLQQNVSITSDYTSSEIDSSSLGIGTYIYQIVVNGEIIARGKIAITQ